MADAILSTKDLLSVGRDSAIPDTTMSRFAPAAIRRAEDALHVSIL
jgi:hypothetical protein